MIERRLGGAWVLWGFILLAWVSGCAEPARKPGNLLLISIDTLVPGRMSTYGGSRKTTPFIDALSKRSVRFDNAFSTAPWTLPAHASMLTGLYPHSLSADPRERRFYDLAPKLAERFAAAKFATGAVTGGGYVSEWFGVSAGFESFEEIKKAEGAKPPLAAFSAWLKKNHEERFFFFFHTFIAHEPLTDRRYVRPGSGGRLRDIYLPKNKGKLHFNVCCREMLVTDAERDFMLDLYDGGVAAADEVVGELIAGLEKYGLLENTDIVITSDHGQEFWQHTGRGGHGHSLYQEQLRIPLIWYQPGMGASGSVQTKDVSLVDIAPTLVARFGLDTSDTFDGVDLGPLLHGEPWNVDRSLFAESIHHGPERFSAWTPDAKLTITPDPSTPVKEMIETGGGPNPVSVAAPVEIFLRADEDEAHNVADSIGESKVAMKLRQALDAHRAAPQVTRARPDTGSSQGLDSQLEAEVVEELRALGYVE